MTQENLEKIYVTLLSEGTDVWRPVQAVALGDGVYQIISENKVLDDEQWQFSTGEFVRCRQKSLNDGSVGLIAYECIPGQRTI